MANKAKVHNMLNHERQRFWKSKGVIMMPTKREQKQFLAWLERKNGVQVT